MSKPVAKKKAKRKAEIEAVFDPKAQRKAEKRIRNLLMELDERSEEREHFSQVILSANEASVLDIVDSITESLVKMHPITDSMMFEGQAFRLASEELDLVKKIQARNFRYVAVRLLIACAEWGIRAGDFKLPKHNCAKCGKKVK